MIQRSAMVERRLALASDVMRVLVPVVRKWVSDRSEVDPLSGEVLFDYNVTPDENVEDSDLFESLTVTSFNGLEMTIALAAKAAEVTIELRAGDQVRTIADHIVQIEVRPQQRPSVRLYSQKSASTVSAPMDFDGMLGQLEDMALKIG